MVPSEAARDDDDVTLLVRAGEPRDASRIAAIGRRAWQRAYEHIFSTEFLRQLETSAAVDEAVDRWGARLAELPQSGQVVLVAEDDGEVVGWVYVAPAAASGVLEVVGLYVDPSRWGDLVGTTLLQEGIAAARQAGDEQLVLWALADNARARRFYEVRGWTTDGARRDRDFGGETAVEVRYRYRG